MKLLHAVSLLLLAPGFILAQADSQKPDPSPSNSSDIAAELKALREALSQTQKQIALQQREIEELKKQANAGHIASVSNQERSPQSPRPIDAVMDTAAPPPDSDAVATAGESPIAQQATKELESVKEKESPLSFKIGGTAFTPGGFVDFENIFRTTNTQNNIATNYAVIPFSNTVQGRLTEGRTTAQYSRLSLKVTGKFGANDVTGYVEADFSGNDATTVFQTVGGHSERLRLAFVDLKRGKWEILGGQTWSWLAPNRNGVSPMPADLALTYNEDQNIGAGLPYSRAAEFRLVYHPNDHWALGVGIEDPDQFIGGFVALPTAFSSTLSPQFDNGSQVGTPNFFPDVLAKIAYDNEIARRHFHLETTGLLTGARAVLPIAGNSFSSHSAIGGGIAIATNCELIPKLRFLANAYWSDGGGRYLVATGPQLVIRPNADGKDISPSMVHAGAGSAGLEWQATPKTVLATYYGADYFQRNFFADTTDTKNPATIIGYGGPGSLNTNNRAIQQATFDVFRTLWGNPQYGALQFYTQYSYLTRAPWFVAAGAPKNAHLSMVYLGFRYALP